MRAFKLRTEACKVVVERAVDLRPPASPVVGQIRKKRRSGKSNWPRNATERAAWMARRAERAARRQELGHRERGSCHVDAPRATGGDDEAPYVPTSAERISFGHLAEAIASRLGVASSRVSALSLQVSMSDPNSPVDDRFQSHWWRRRRHSHAAHVCVALEDGTPAPLVRTALGAGSGASANSIGTGTAPEPLALGEAFVMHPAELLEATGDGDLVPCVVASVAIA